MGIITHSKGATARIPMSKKAAIEKKTDPLIQTTQATIKSRKHVQIKSDVRLDNHSRNDILEDRRKAKNRVGSTPNIFQKRSLVIALTC